MRLAARRSLEFAAILLLYPVMIVHAQTKILGANAIQSSGVIPPSGPLPSVEVTFDTPLPKEGDVTQASRWTISSQGDKTNRALKVLGVFTTDFSADHAVYLQLNVDWNFFCNSSSRQKVLQIVFQSDTEYVTPSSPQAINCGSSISPNTPVTPLVSAKKQDDSDIYVKGSYTGVENGDPSWDLDSFGGYMWELGKPGALGAYAQAKTSSSKSADLDSFTAYGLYIWSPARRTGFTGPFQTPFLAYHFAQGEFDRKLNQLNFIQSPIIIVPFRLATKTAVSKDYSALSRNL
jgi:hypothetical protein